MVKVDKITRINIFPKMYKIDGLVAFPLIVNRHIAKLIVNHLNKNNKKKVKLKDFEIK